MIKNIIYNNDCINILDNMQLIKSNSVDLIIADPPYFEICGGFDYQWENVNTYIDWCKSWLEKCERILKPSGTIYLWGAIGYNKGFALPQIAKWIEDTDLFKIQNWITQRNCRGYATKKNFMSCREELLFMTKSKDNYTFNIQYLEEESNRKDLGYNGKPRKNTYKRPSNVWNDNPEDNILNINDVWTDIAEASQSSNERFKLSNCKSFPTVKALKLCNRIILSSSNKNDLVFIPFAGSGSEIISCLQNERNFIACEKESIYIDEIIIPRINKLNTSNMIKIQTNIKDIDYNLTSNIEDIKPKNIVENSIIEIFTCTI